MKKPPSDLRLRFCPVCGRDDAATRLLDTHFANGKICKGKPKTFTYVRVGEP